MMHRAERYVESGKIDQAATIRGITITPAGDTPGRLVIRGGEEVLVDVEADRTVHIPVPAEGLKVRAGDWIELDGLRSVSLWRRVSYGARVGR